MTRDLDESESARVRGWLKRFLDAYPEIQQQQLAEACRPHTAKGTFAPSTFRDWLNKQRPMSVPKVTALSAALKLGNATLVEYARGHIDEPPIPSTNPLKDPGGDDSVKSRIASVERKLIALEARFSQLEEGLTRQLGTPPNGPRSG